MKIAFIANAIVPKSSIGRVILNLAKNFKKKGHQIQIFTINYDESFIKKYGIEKSELIKYKRLNFFNKLSRIPIFGFIFEIFKYNLFGFFLTSKLIKNRPDIINSHYYFCGITGNIVSKIVNIPHVLTIHGVNLSKADMNTVLFWSIELILNFLKRHIRYFISVDPNLKASVRFSEVSYRFETIFPCLDEQYIELLEKIDTKQKTLGDLKLIYVGRLEKKKGLKDLLINLADNNSYWSELKILGLGNYENHLKKLSDKLELSKKVNFIGFKDGIEKLDLINNSDIFISYSRSEGFPLVILEFFALGKPCIIYPVGGITYFRDEFENKKLGIFLEPRKNFLGKMLEPSYISQFFTQKACEARKGFAQNFTPETIARKYFEVFRRILGINGGR